MQRPPVPRKRKAFTPKQRIEIKDKLIPLQKGRCAGCQREITEEFHDFFEIDHIQPFARGGGDEISNLQLLCSPCNRKKGMSEPQHRRKSYSSKSYYDIEYQYSYPSYGSSSSIPRPAGRQLRPERSAIPTQTERRGYGIWRAGPTLTHPDSLSQPIPNTRISSTRNLTPSNSVSQSNPKAGTSSTRNEKDCDIGLRRTIQKRVIDAINGIRLRRRND